MLKSAILLRHVRPSAVYGRLSVRMAVCHTLDIIIIIIIISSSSSSSSSGVTKSVLKVVQERSRVSPAIRGRLPLPKNF